MSDDDRRPPGGGAEDRPLNLILRGAIDRRGRVVQHQDTGVGQEGSRQGDALALAAGQGHSAFPDDRLISLREGSDELIGLSRSRGGLDLSLTGLRTAEGDVLGHAAREEKHILLDDRDLLTESLQIPLTHVDAVDPHRTLADIVVRLSSRISVLFPEPVWPTTAIVWPGATRKLTCCNPACWP